MKNNNSKADDFYYRPLTAEFWSDFVGLFGPKGAYAGCWCMWWRSSRREFEANQGEGNRRLMENLVKSGQVPGILAYCNDRPAGWCSVAPREHYAALERSRVMKRLDDLPVWSIVCFFIGRGFRGQGLGAYLIRASVAYVKQQGGRIVEAYPTIPKTDKLPPVSSFMGLPKLFTRAGFVECARPSASRMIMRYYIEG